MSQVIKINLKLNKRLEVIRLQLIASRLYHSMWLNKLIIASPITTIKNVINSCNNKQINLI